jgi:hypothetical protein
MAEDDWTAETLQAEFENVGEDEVKVRLANKFYSDINAKGSLAREWLLRRELATKAEQAVAASRALEAASRAALAADRAAVASERSAEAAERQANTAERATRTAIAAFIVAMIATIVSLFALKK